jgi:hypothetical protein
MSVCVSLILIRYKTGRRSILDLIGSQYSPNPICSSLRFFEYCRRENFRDLYVCMIDIRTYSMLNYEILNDSLLGRSVCVRTSWFSGNLLIQREPCVNCGLCWVENGRKFNSPSNFTDRSPSHRSALTPELLEVKYSYLGRCIQFYLPCAPLVHW